MIAKRFLPGAPALAVTLSIVLLLCGEGFAQTKRDAKKAKQLADRAAASFVKKDYRAAIDGYGQAIALDANNPDYHFWKGVAHTYLDENQQAVPELNIALEKGFKKPLEVYRVRWRANYANKDFDAALADLKQGVALDPNNVEFLQGLGDISYARNNYPEAIDAYQKVVLKNPNNAAELYLNIARAQKSLGNVDGQIAAAGEAIKRGTPMLGEAYLIQAEGYRKQKNAKAAIDAYKKSIAAKPDSYSAYESLADLYRDENRFADAIDISRKALSVFQRDGRIYTSLSWYYSLAGRSEEAVQAAQAAIVYLPDQYLGYTYLCRAYNDVKKPEMAIRECNNALKRNPNDGETFFYLARAYDLAGKPDEATKQYKRAVSGLADHARQRPDDADGFYLLGNAYFADNQLDKAIQAYEKSLELSPRFAKARYNVAIIQLRQKNKTAALEQYNRLLTLDPDLAGKLKVEIDRS